MSTNCKTPSTLATSAPAVISEQPGWDPIPLSTLSLELIEFAVHEQRNRDRRYYCPSREWLDEFAAWLRLNKDPYADERWDCDDFALWCVVSASKSLLKSSVFTGPGAHTVFYAEVVLENGTMHALNLVRCSNEEWYVLEPQTGEIERVAMALAVGHIRSIEFVWL